MIEIDQDDTILVNGVLYRVDFRQLPEGSVFSLLLDNRSFEAAVEEREGFWEVLIRGELYPVRVQDERAYRLSKARGKGSAVTGEAMVKSPMPGIIVSVSVGVGDEVQKGDKVVILESMKMENELRAPRNGRITRVNVEKGTNVEKDQVLVVIGES